MNIKEKIRNLTLENIDLSKEITEEEILRTIDSVLMEFSKKTYIPMQDKLILRGNITFHPWF